MLRTCKECGSSNRIPSKFLAATGKCGSCKAVLPAQQSPITVESAQEFDDITRNAKVPVLVDFWATWCPPCRQAAPHVQTTAEHTQGKALVLKVDTDRNPELASRFGVQSIPNFVVIKDGKTVMQKAGAVDARTMEQWLEQAR